MGISTGPSTDLPMLAFVSSSAIHSPFHFDSKPSIFWRNHQLTDAIVGLHSILVNPASMPGEAKSAKQRMLKILDQARQGSHPWMIAGLFAEPDKVERGSAQPTVEPASAKRRPRPGSMASPGHALPVQKRRVQTSHEVRLASARDNVTSHSISTPTWRRI